MRWKDWHRGSGCSLDDGKPRTESGAAEVAAFGADHPHPSKMTKAEK